jgi:hypothetical protein
MCVKVHASICTHNAMRCSKEVTRSQRMAYGRAPRSAVVFVRGFTADSIYEMKYAAHQLGGSKDGDEGED